MNQYIKGLGGDSEDAGMSFSVSHFENALNNANEQLMQQYIATEACFSVTTSTSFLSKLEKPKKDSELALEDRLNKIIAQDAMQRKLNKIFNFKNILA